MARRNQSVGFGSRHFGSVSRRDMLRGGVSLSAAALSARVAAGAHGTSAFWQDDAVPTSEPVGTGEKGQVVIRSAGGAFEDAWREAAWQPFAQETGIQVIPIATTVPRLIAMVQSGVTDVDVVDTGEVTLLRLIDQGGLEQLDRSKIQRTNLADVDLVTDYYFGSIVYATVIGFRNDEFASGAPESWADVWNTSEFPGSRSMTDMASGVVDLEFALMADGVPMDQLYPIDVERAFGKLEEIRDDVIKWWDTGANGAQLLVDKQSVIGSVFNGRLQPFVEEGVPVGLNWNGGERFNQGFGIVKGAPNIEEAYQLIDFSMQPEVMAMFCEKIFYGPANRKAFDFIDGAVASKLPTSPENLEITFAFDPIWWKDNTDAIAERWQEFLLG